VKIAWHVSPQWRNVCSVLSSNLHLSLARCLLTRTLRRCVRLCVLLFTLERLHCSGFVQASQRMRHPATFMHSASVTKEHSSVSFGMLTSALNICGAVWGCETRRVRRIKHRVLENKRAWISECTHLVSIKRFELWIENEVFIN
jgi:hypothetical protein